MLVRALVCAGLFVLWLGAACSAPAPRAAPPSPAPTRPVPTATPRPEDAPLALVLLQLDEVGVPPPEATPVGLSPGRPTATPYATADVAWKYVTFTVAVENRSDTPRLLSIAGVDSLHTNLNDAMLIAADGMRYKPFRSYSGFGLRTATARSLNSYPVLLRLPPGLRVTAESFGALSTAQAPPTTVTFRVPSGTTEYRTLSVPLLNTLGARDANDEVAKRIRSLLGTFQPLALAGVRVGQQALAASPTPSNVLAAGAAQSVPGQVSVSLASAETSDPTDFQARNRGWRQLAVGLRYRNEDPNASHTYNMAAWVFGDDGVVYTGDVPALGDFGRATAAPEPGIIAAWDGRTAGPDQVGAGQEQETRRPTFQVPQALHGGLLVLAGDVDATFRLDWT